MTRRQLFQTAAAGLPALAQARQRNVLLLIADDLGLHTGAYGDSTAVTPNLDALARDGVRFSNAFCTTASCSASRSVILSGLHNHSNGQYGHAHSTHNFGYLPFVRPLPALLKDAGYKTGVIGKLHVNPIQRFRWDLDAQIGGRDVSEMAGRAKAFIQEAGAQSWYLHMGFTDPHRAARGFANRDYPGVKRTPFDPARVAVPPFLPDTPGVREEVAEYYEAANRLDQGIGMMMNVLRETGQLDNTLVIFISDNGMPFANAKTNLYDAGSRLPMIVRSPNQSRRGVVNHGLTSWVDIAPTALDWAGAKPPAYPLHGKSVLPTLEEDNPAGREEVYFSHTYHEITMYYPTRGVRTRRYKYLRNLFPELEFPHASDLWASRTWQGILEAGDGAAVGQRPVKAYLHRAAEELYDIEADPNEVRNLAADSAHAATLLSLRAKVAAFRRDTKDPWTINDVYKGEDGGDSNEERSLRLLRRKKR
ncbi:MAG: sulfatase [Acidobacteria bacterium]|nr:sulfatase [Acidobacteriota bacterium]